MTRIFDGKSVAHTSKPKGRNPRAIRYWLTRNWFRSDTNSFSAYSRPPPPFPPPLEEHCSQSKRRRNVWWNLAYRYIIQISYSVTLWWLFLLRENMFSEIESIYWRNHIEFFYTRKVSSYKINYQYRLSDRYQSCNILPGTKREVLLTFSPILIYWWRCILIKDFFI